MPRLPPRDLAEARAKRRALRARLAPTEVSGPLTFLRQRERRSPGGLPTPAIQAASSGFLTLSTLCSPADLPGLFRPGSAYGVLPPRFVFGAEQQAVRPLERRSPHVVRHASRSREPSTSGFSTCCPASPPKPWGLTKTRDDDLPGLLPLRGLSIQRRLRHDLGRARLHPLSRFRDASHAWLRHRRLRVLSTEHLTHLS